MGISETAAPVIGAATGSFKVVRIAAAHAGRRHVTIGKAPEIRTRDIGNLGRLSFQSREKGEAETTMIVVGLSHRRSDPMEEDRIPAG